MSPQLALLAKEFEKLDLLTVSLNKSLKAIAVDSSAFRSLTTATNATNRALERASISAERLQGHLAAVHRLGSMPAPPMLPPPGRPPGGGGTGGGGWGHRNNGFHGGNVHMGPGGIGIGSIGMAAGDAFVPLAVTAGLLYAGKSLFESAKALDTEKQRFRLFGMTDAQNQNAFSFAKNLNVYGTTQVERLSAMREAQGVFRESGLPGSAALEGAKLATSVLAKLDFLASSLDDESHARMHTANLSMLRYVESSGGLKSASEFNRIADFGYKLNVSSGGTVNWEQLRQFKARAGAAGFHLTDDAMARLEPVIAEMKGGAVGFGLSTAFNRLSGANKGIPTQMVHELLENGVWDKNRVVLNRMGGFKNTTDDLSPLSKDKIGMLTTNPELFYESYIRPIYSKMKLDSAEIARQNVMIFGTTGGRNMTLVDNQMANIHASVEAMKKTMGIDEATKLAKNSLSGEQKEFEAAWTDFKTQFGTVVLPFFSKILKGGASIFRGINDGKPAATVSAFADLNRYVGQYAGKLASDWFAEGPTKVALDQPASKSSKPIPINLNIDGRKIVSVLFDPMSNLLSGSPTGGANPDGSLHSFPVSQPRGVF